MKNTIESLADLEKLERGLVRGMFMRELGHVMDDLRSRAGIKKPRTLKVELTLVPTIDESGALGGVVIEVSISTKVPTSRTRPYHTAPVGNGLCFDDLSPDDANQRTFEGVG